MEIDSIKKNVSRGKKALLNGQRGLALKHFEKACRLAEERGRRPEENKDILSLKAGLDLMGQCVAATKSPKKK